jgi:tetrahydromethanopterin S-methyltransferase subunit A
MRRDPKGFIVIDVEREAGKIVARHYLPDGSPANVMRGRSGEGIMLALVREGLVTQLSHAAYLGAEFEKAETALRFGFGYEQDKPLARPT